MIVVEGPDGTGKTTLVNRLSEDLCLNVGKRGTDNRDELYKVTREDTYRALAHAVEGYHPPFIWDRLGVFSDPIYSYVQGRKCAFSRHEHRFITRILRSLNCPIILCMVPRTLAEENIAKAHQMEGVNDNYAYIYSAYRGLTITTSTWTWRYVYTDDDAYSKLRISVEKYLKNRKEREWH